MPAGIGIPLVEGLREGLDSIVEGMFQFMIKMDIFDERGKDEADASKEFEVFLPIGARHSLVEINESIDLPLMHEGNAERGPDTEGDDAFLFFKRILAQCILKQKRLACLEHPVYDASAHGRGWR
jgi:hypothetical protein